LKNQYDAASIEVLTGLEPVRKRPGMYTDTTRPNHLAQEVIDNSVDEAIAGYATQIGVILHADQSLSVIDNGRGMPVDIHPQQKIPGVEVILTKLHAGGKFSNKNYQFSGGLHGVGVSVVNALSKQLDVRVRRDGKEYTISFRGGEKKDKLTQTGTVGKKNSGTSLRFWPDPKYFDSPSFSVTRLKHILRAKAVLCPGLRVKFYIERTKESVEWLYEDGLSDYLLEALEGYELLPPQPFFNSLQGEHEAVDWAVSWLPQGGESITESYVNLIPTSQGGTHVNGLRTGITDAIREFCEFRNLLPRGVKLSPDDVWDNRSRWRIRSFRARPRKGCLRGKPRPSFPAWPRIPSACGLTSMPISAISSRSWRFPARKAASKAPRRWCGKRLRPARRCPESCRIAAARTWRVPSCFWSRATRPVARPSRRGTARSRRSCRYAARF
jgi:topoisomerase-4 subunit B